jgi:ArsR family metal-binding transcriptional regulator
MTDDALVSAITLIRTLPCLADPGKLIVIGETGAAIDAALPLLNAILLNAEGDAGPGRGRGRRAQLRRPVRPCNG